MHRGLSKQHGPFSHVVECGAGTPDYCFAKFHVGDPECRVDLFDPHPDTARELRRAFRSLPNVHIYEVAIGQESRSVDLCVPVGKGGQLSAFLVANKAPATHMGLEVKKKIVVRMERFDLFDDGSIDLLILDMEGMELALLEQMISRPKLLQIELDHKGRIHPDGSDIRRWLKANHYTFISQSTDDWFFARNP